MSDTTTNFPVTEAPSGSGDPLPDAGQPSPATEQDPFAGLPEKLPRLVNGKLEYVDTRRVIADSQKVEAAGRAFQEAAAIRKREERFVAELKQDPFAAIERYSKESGANVDLLSAAKKQLYELYQREQMSPTERENYELKRWKESKEREEQEKTAKEEHSQYEAEQARFAQELVADAKKVLAEKRVPQNRDALRRFVEVKKAALSVDYDIPPAEAAHLVRESYRRDLTEFAKDAEGDDLLELLGDDLLRRVRQADLSRYRKAKGTPATGTSRMSTEEQDLRQVFTKPKQRERRPRSFEEAFGDTAEVLAQAHRVGSGRDGGGERT